DARIFLERSIGLDRTRDVTKDDVKLWAWHHRWFKPLQVEEWGVDVAPTGEIIGYSDKLLDEDRVPDADAATARAIAEGFLRGAHTPHPAFGHLLPAAGEKETAATSSL